MQQGGWNTGGKPPGQGQGPHQGQGPNQGQPMRQNKPNQEQQKGQNFDFNRISEMPSKSPRE